MQNYETTPVPSAIEESRIEELIREEHFWIDDQLKRLTRESTGLSVNDKRNLFDQVKFTVLHHMLATEKTYYDQIPKLLADQNDRAYQLIQAQLRKSLQEHHQAKLLMDELEDLAVEDPDWPAKLKVLQEDLAAHHAQDEEKFLKLTEAKIPKQTAAQLAVDFRKAKNKAI